LAPFTIPVRFDLFPAWKDAVLEDVELQEKAADRLVQYINEGRAHGRNGQAPIRIEAEKITIAPHVGKVGSLGPTGGGSVVYGIRVSLEVEVSVA
jgi:hypothetical protein